MPEWLKAAKYQSKLPKVHEVEEEKKHSPRSHNGISSSEDENENEDSFEESQPQASLGFVKDTN